jgi:hypothetical protein
MDFAKLFRALMRSLFSWRALAAVIFGIIALWLQSTGLLDHTFLGTWDKSLFDEVVNIRENTVGGRAPPVIVANFGGAARRAYFAAHPPAGLTPPINELEYPQLTPFAVVRQAMLDGKRMQARVIMIDIDLSPRRPAGSDQEIADFTAFLKSWAADPAAPLAIFLRAQPAREQGQPAPPPLLVTPWDGLMETAPNLTWGGSNAEANSDGILRYQDYYTCVRRADGGYSPLMGAPILVAAAAADGARGAAKGAVLLGLAKAKACETPPSAWAAATPPADKQPAFQVAIGGRTITAPSAGGLIDYHINDPALAGGGAPPPVGPGDWASDVPVINTFPPGELLDGVGPELGRGAILVFGSSQPNFPDVHWTPYRLMDGDIILANCARGIALVGPIRDMPLWVQALGLLSMLLATHFFYQMFEWANSRAHRLGKGVTGAVARGATSPAIAKIYALALMYATSILAGSILLDHGYWDSTPFVAASIYILIGDALEILEGRNLKETEEPSDEE